MPTQLQLEGPELEPLLDRVRLELPPGARILQAEKVRTGGIGGFFARQRYELTVEVDDVDAGGLEPAAGAGAAPAGAALRNLVGTRAGDVHGPVVGPGAAGRGSAPTSGLRAPEPSAAPPPVSLLDLVDQVSEQEQAVVSTQSPTFASLMSRLGSTIGPSPEPPVLAAADSQPGPTDGSAAVPPATPAASAHSAPGQAGGPLGAALSAAYGSSAAEQSAVVAGMDGAAVPADAGAGQEAHVAWGAGVPGAPPPAPAGAAVTDVPAAAALPAGAPAPAHLPAAAGQALPAGAPAPAHLPAGAAPALPAGAPAPAHLPAPAEQALPAGVPASAHLPAAAAPTLPAGAPALGHVPQPPAAPGGGALTSAAGQPPADGPGGAALPPAATGPVGGHSTPATSAAPGTDLVPARRSSDELVPHELVPHELVAHQVVRTPDGSTGASAAPATVTGSAVEAVHGVAALPARPTTGPLAGLVRLGLPAHLLPADDGTDLYPALVAQLRTLPKVPRTANRAGSVLAVVGPLAAAVDVARDVAQDLGLSVGTAVFVAGGARAPKGVLERQRVRDPEAALAKRAGWRRRSGLTVVAVEADLTASGAARARAFLTALEPSTTWGVVEATRKAQDVGAWTRALGGVHALALAGVEETADPAAVLELGIPVSRLGGRPATPAVWASLLTGRLAA